MSDEKRKSLHCLRVTACFSVLASCPILIFLCVPVTRPAAKVFAECEQLDGQNHLTAGKEPDRHFKDMRKQRIQDDPQDVVAMLTIGRERKVQNHVYQWEEGSGNPSCIGFDEDEKLLKSGWNFSRYPWRIVGTPPPAQRNVLYGTAYAQRVIWEHQNPSDCSKAKFLEYRHDVSGIGSQLHLHGQALALAMHLGRILVLPQDAQMHYYDKSFCPGEENWDCWFQPITWCKTRGDVLKVFEDPLLNGTDFDKRAVPEIFRPMLDCSPIKNGAHFYWWRAQSIVYLTRFNERTRKAVDHLRSESLMQCKEKVSELHLLPPGSISTHVRHGLKITEAPLFPFEDYAYVMEKLASGNQRLPILHADYADGNASFTYEPVLYSERKVFVSTEDPKVIEEALKLCGRWKVMYTKAKRSNDDTWMKTWKDADARQEVLNALVNLELALEADGWVCTLSSNWCRLIDELRQTVAMKAGRPYLSLSKPSRARIKPPKNSYLSW